jgi:acyl transferase domain-containing protein
VKLAQYVYSQMAEGQLAEQDGKEFLAQLLPAEIAIVGMSCEYSGVTDVHSFEELLRGGRNGFRTFPQSRRRFFPRDHRYLVDAARDYGRDDEELFQEMCDQVGSYLDDVDQFDADFFEIPDDEAVYVDPLHRLALKHLYLALEHSGIRRDEIQGTRTAIYVGKDRSVAGSYASEIEADSALINPGTWEGILASRLNYLYDLRGGSLVVDTACSSSLVAVHLAAKMLRDREIDVALVGGVAMGLAPRRGEVFGDGTGVETVSDHLKVFDQASSGTIFGEGVGVVVLRRLADAVAHNDHVYSILRATGINSDGKSNGLTAPNPKAQTDLIRDTYAAASISPATIDYIDAHGTGTKLGDPIEIRGLTDAFRSGGMTGYSTCALSSLKENIGHTVGAAGVGGLIKMSLALDSGMIYPACGFEVPNDYIKFIDTPFYVPDALAEWPRQGHPRRGAVSGFGFSGTNGHVVLEEYEQAPRRATPAGPLPFLLSAPSPEQLGELIAGYLRHESLVREQALRDVSYTLARRRTRHRAAVGFCADSYEAFFAGLRRAQRALAGQPHPDVAVGLADGGATMGPDAVALLRRRADLLTLDERLALTVTERVDLLDDGLFAGAQVCSLPGHVFATRSFWGKVKTYNVYGTGTGTGTGQGLAGAAVEGGVLIGTKVFSTPSSDVFGIHLDPAAWYLNDHQIANQSTLSGTAYTQLAAELAQLYFGTPAYELRRVAFRSLIRAPQPREVFVEVTHAQPGQHGQHGEHQVEVFSPGDDPWAPVVQHGSFVLRPLDPATARTSTAAPSRSWPDRCACRAATRRRRACPTPAAGAWTTTSCGTRRSRRRTTSSSSPSPTSTSRTSPTSSSPRPRSTCSPG